MNICFVGYYGMSNYGDDIFGLACSWAAKRYWMPHRTTILSPKLRDCDDTIFEIPLWFPNRLYSHAGVIGKLSRLSFTIRSLRKNDYIVFAGGSILSSMKSSRMTLIQYVSSKNIIGLAGIGVSVGPFLSSEDERNIERFLKMFSFLAVRDTTSYERVKYMNLPYAPVLARDLGGLLPEIVTRSKKGTDQLGYFGVSICNYEQFMQRGNRTIEQKRNYCLFEGIRRFCLKNGVPVRIFVLNTHPKFGDLSLSRELELYLNGNGIRSECVSLSQGIREIWRKIAVCHAFLSVRLHGAISAYLAGVPFTLVEYHSKCSDFLQDIGQPQGVRLGMKLDTPGTVVRVLEKLFYEQPRPTFERQRYINESRLNFTSAPWATQIAGESS